MNALFLLSDNGYLNLTINTIASFRKNNSWFAGDINILFAEDNSPDYTCEGINFFPIDKKAYDSKYFTLMELVDFLKIPERKYKTIFKIEAFKYHDRYEKILFIDSDCIVRGSLQSLFNSDESLIFRYPGSVFTNSGVFYSVKNQAKYMEMLGKLSKMSRQNVEELIFTESLKNFKNLDEIYNETIGFTSKTVIQHLQFEGAERVLELQNEYNLL